MQSPLNATMQEHHPKQPQIQSASMIILSRRGIFELIIYLEGRDKKGKREKQEEVRRRDMDMDMDM